MNLFILSQILVGIAFCTDLISFQFKERKKVVLFLCLSSALISTHYFLLGRNTAGLLVFISIIRFITSYFSTRKILMFSIIGLNILGFLLTYSSPLSFIILFALILITIGAFQKEDKSLRRIIMMGTCFVITYDILIFSPIAIILEISFLLSNVIGYFRFYYKKKKKVIYT